MNIPNIRYYARLEDCTGNGKTPKYVITAQAGYYPPMDEICKYQMKNAPHTN